jgi:hypothetical protein
MYILVFGARMYEESSLMLENLVCGKTECVEIASKDTTRESVVELLNTILFSHFPGCLLHGEFLDKENANYLVYEVHFSEKESHNDFSAIRLLDFGDKLRLIRV